jgi:hypothetical protein
MSEFAETKKCPNCGETTVRYYCANCGQKQTNLNAPFKQLISDFLGNVLTFDSRFLRTLIPLLTKPGFLTASFVAGQRVRYVPPLRLYVFISVIFFFSLALSDLRIYKVAPVSRPANTPNAAPAERETILDRSSRDVPESQQKSSPKRKSSLSQSLKRKLFEQMRKANETPKWLMPRYLIVYHSLCSSWCRFSRCY